jgi:hypothetical protein
MDRGNRTQARLCALFLLGCLLLLPPLLLVFNHADRVLGIPTLYFYVFLAWSMLIALAAAIARAITPDVRAAGEAGAEAGAAGSTRDA